MEAAQEESSALTVESAGVDWLTATAPRNRDGDPFKSVGDDLLSQSASHGNDVRGWSAHGYHGWASGGVVTGTRHDGFIIKLTSDDAREDWRKVYQHAANVSRIDVQITLRLKVVNALFVSEQRSHAIAARMGKGRRANVTLIQSTADGDSLYLGKRSSDIYARVYDKGKEQKSDPAGSLIRQELEYKSERAAQVAAHLASSSSEAVDAASLVSAYIKRFGIETVRNGNEWRMGARGRASDDDARVRWLNSSIRPSIIKLLASNRLEDVLSALGLDELVIVKSTLPVKKRGRSKS